jgi:hypothetical protein
MDISWGLLRIYFVRIFDLFYDDLRFFSNVFFCLALVSGAADDSYKSVLTDFSEKYKYSDLHYYYVIT